MKITTSMEVITIMATRQKKLIVRVKRCWYYLIVIFDLCLLRCYLYCYLARKHFITYYLKLDSFTNQRKMAFFHITLAWQHLRSLVCNIIMSHEMKNDAVTCRHYHKASCKQVFLPVIFTLTSGSSHQEHVLAKSQNCSQLQDPSKIQRTIVLQNCQMTKKNRVQCYFLLLLL